MKQSRRASFIESWANILVGFGIQYAASAVVLNGVLSIPIGWRDNLILGVIMTVVSLARSFSLRRIFEHLRVTGVLQ